MDRRTVLAGLAAAVTAPALAQTSGSPSTRQPSAASGSTGGAPGASRMGGQPMTQADMQHMQQTMQLGLVALETSRIAQQKAQNADLKRFATFEVQEQTTLSEVLRSMMEPAATSATGSAAQPSAGSGASAPAMQMDAQCQRDDPEASEYAIGRGLRSPIPSGPDGRAQWPASGADAVSAKQPTEP